MAKSAFARGVAPDETQRRSRLVLHTLPILLIPIFSAFVTALLIRVITQDASLRPPDAARGPVLGVTAIIVIAVFLTALITLVRLGRPTASALMLIGAWTLITTVAALRGGVASIGPALLIIPICAAGLLIDGVASMSLAALATILVGALAWLEMKGLYMIPDARLPVLTPPFAQLAPPLFTAGIWTGLFWTVALLTSLLAGGLQRALRQSRAQQAALRELSDQLETRVAAQTAELAQRATQAEALYDISRVLTSTLDLDHVLASIAEQAARLLGFDTAQVLSRQPGGSFATVGAYPHAQDGATGDAGLGFVAEHEHLLRQVEEDRTPRMVTLAGCEPAAGQGAVALIVPMHYRTGFAGMLLLTASAGCADCGEDGLVLAQGLADQAAVAIANAQLLDRARETATLKERTRLARDIHDTLAQGLTGVVVQLGAAQRALALAPEEAQEHLSLAQRMARESLAEARRSVWNLRTPVLDCGALSDALRALTVRGLATTVAVTFEQVGEPWPLSSAVESTLLRVCQEALVNVAKHAQATQAGVVLEYRPDGVQLWIRDNGVGFDRQIQNDLAAGTSLLGGFGLMGMCERVVALGGALQLSNKGGAQVLAEIPRSAAHGPAEL